MYTDTITLRHHSDALEWLELERYNYLILNIRAGFSSSSISQLAHSLKPLKSLSLKRR